MINPLRLLFSPTITVEWDNTVRSSLKQSYRNSNSETIRIRLFDLLKGIGCVQPKRINSSWLTSVLDYAYLIECLYDEPELRVRIAEIKDSISSEALTEVSEYLGIGLSVSVVSQLFDIQQSTISKIKKSSSKRPDWQCLFSDNRILIVEAKGSTSSTTSKLQLKSAVQQKITVPGDVRIATGAVLNEDSISSMSVIDPPIIEIERDGNYRNVLRANHYSSVFSFLGEEVLSLYFEKMAKRLSGTISKKEMKEKEVMYEELNYHAPSIILDQIEYAGHLYKSEGGIPLFIGVTKQLLSYQGFIDYQDAVEERVVERDGNHFLFYPDGILIITILNAENFYNDYHINSIEIGIESIVLSDLDSIKGNSFKRYVKYLLDRCADNVQWVDNRTIKAYLNSAERRYSVYHVHNAKDGYTSYKELNKLATFMEKHNGVLVTNLRIPRQEFAYPCIDRADFERIVQCHADAQILSEIFSR